jgi:hypothetical protein
MNILFPRIQRQSFLFSHTVFHSCGSPCHRASCCRFDLEFFFRGMLLPARFCLLSSSLFWLCWLQPAAVFPAISLPGADSFSPEVISNCCSACLQVVFHSIFRPRRAAVFGFVQALVDLRVCSLASVLRSELHQQSYLSFVFWLINLCSGFVPEPPN